jgi:DNA recombination protein RmuC
VRALGEGLVQILQRGGEAQRERLDIHARLIEALAKAIEAQHVALRHAVETRLDALRAENAQRLEDMRQAIDGELQTARDVRLFDSVKRVSESLDQVHKAVGEMQSIAAGVGGPMRALEGPR